MKQLFLLISLSLSLLNYSQDFDSALESMAKSMSRYLNGKSDLSIAVYPFYNQKNIHTDLSKLISEDFSVYLNQNNTYYKLIERTYLEQMMEEHHLNAEGLIDPRTAKEFGMIIAADLYITGRAMVFSSYIRLHVFAINTQTGERVYSDFKKVPLDEDIAEFIGIMDLKERQEKTATYTSSNPDCKEQNVGDYCFVNKSNKDYIIRISDKTNSYLYNSIRRITVRAFTKKCVKDLTAGKSYKYTANKQEIMIGDMIPQGEFFVGKCKSGLIEIY